MAVVITDTRTLWSDCDTANWTLGESDALFTAQPSPKELSGCLGFQISETNTYGGLVVSSIDLDSGVLVYGWLLAQGTIDDTQTGGQQLMLGDGTDRIGFHVGGSDKAGFRHDIGGVNWQCYLMDTSILTTYYTEHLGTLVALDLTAITNAGIGASVASKSLGGTENIFADVLRVGNGGIIITGGGSGTEGNFTEIATSDSDNTSAASSWGICREVATGVFGLQGPLTFGNTGTGSVDFYATNELVSFEDRDIGTDKYFITITGNSTGTTTFQLGTQVGATYDGQNGCTISCPVGVGASFTATNADLDYVLLYGNTLVGFNNGMDFSADATNGPNHEIYGNNFIGCAQINAGTTSFKNNSISSSTDSATGGLLLGSDGNSTWEDLSFTSAGTGHALYITASGTYTFDNYTYINYGADDTTDAEVYNNSGSLVTINVLGGDSPTVRNGTSASTVINNTVNLVVHVQDSDGNDIETAQTAIYQTSDDTELLNADTDVNGDVSTEFNYTIDVPIYVRIRKSSPGDTRYFPYNTTGIIRGDGYTLTVVMIEDTIVSS